MIPLEEYKKYLGDDLLSSMTEEEIIELKNWQEELAEVAFSMWAQEINLNNI